MNITKMKKNDANFPWVGWSVVILFFCLLGSTMTVSPAVFCVVFVPFAYAGVYFADWLRRIAYPHTIIYSGVFDALGKKFFWNFGPQLIALFIIMAVIADMCGTK